MSGNTLSGLNLGGHGGGGHKASKWVKWIAGIAGIAVVWATSPTLGALLTTLVAGGLIVLDCVKHPLHILRYLGALVLVVALLPNIVFGPWMQDVGRSIGSGGDRAAPVVQSWLPASKGNLFNPVPAPTDPAAGQTVAAPTTTAPPAGASPALPVTAPILTGGPR